MQLDDGLLHLADGPLRQTDAIRDRSSRSMFAQYSKCKYLTEQEIKVVQSFRFSNFKFVFYIHHPDNRREKLVFHENARRLINFFAGLPNCKSIELFVKRAQQAAWCSLCVLEMFASVRLCVKLTASTVLSGGLSPMQHWIRLRKLSTLFCKREKLFT